MAMYYYASKISAIACGTHCRQNVLRKSRGQRDRDKDTLQESTAGFHPQSPEHDLNMNYAGAADSSPEKGIEASSNAGERWQMDL